LGHIGQCYVKLGEPQKAAEYYRRALKIYQRWGNYPGGMMSETVSEYCKILNSSGKTKESQALAEQFRTTGNVDNIP